MTTAPISHVRILAQTNPVPNLTAQWTERTMLARETLAQLELHLRQIDHLAGLLKDDHGITVATDLGPIGNAAQAARRDLDRDNGHHFQLPKPA